MNCVLYTGADLSDADLRGADFSLANVTKVSIDETLLPEVPVQQFFVSSMCTKYTDFHIQITCLIQVMLINGEENIDRAITICMVCV